MTFDEWWEQADKPFGEAKSFKEAALSGWLARQKLDAEICEKASEYDPNAVEGAMKSKRWIEEVE